MRNQLYIHPIIICFICCLGFHTSHAKTNTYSSNVITANRWDSRPEISSQGIETSVNLQNQTVYKTKSIRSYIKLSLNTDNIPQNVLAFKAIVPIKITYVLNDGPNRNTPITEDKLLSVDYNPILGAKYKNVDVLSIPNARKVVVAIQNNGLTLEMNSAQALTDDIKKFISLQTFTEHERYYNFNNIYGNSAISDFSVSAISSNYNSTNNELTIQWNPNSYAEGYELEYTFVDDYSDNIGSFIPANRLSFTFKNNSTRLLLKQTQYTLPLVQEHGYLVYRVRGYGLAGENYEQLFYGPFEGRTGGANPGQEFNVGNYPNSNKYYVTNNTVHANDKINWQSVTTFAEEGKSKTVVKYMDGTMRERQLVTSTSTEKNAIVAETIYDFQGRPAVNILPAPVDNPAIKYYSNFNQNMNGKPYSYLDFDFKGMGCEPFAINPLKQSNNLGAGNYYSKENPSQKEFNAYIPEAKGYPFSRVIYMPDQTQRVVRQGGVGEIFQPGKTTNTNDDNHDTKFFYGKPEQEKLDKLFGTNVGYAEHYQKNLVVDANGQAAVSYVDLDGKTIATALAGEVPKNVDPLESYQALPITINLLNGSDVIDVENHTITNAQSFLMVSENTNYHINYALNPKTFQALTCSNKSYCLDCIYDLEIKITNDQCGIVEYSKVLTVGSLENLNSICNDAYASLNIDSNVILKKVGSYTISKKLTVNGTAATTYASNIINDPTNSCLKTFDDFYEEAWEKRDTNRCKTACESCEAESSLDQPIAEITRAQKICDSLWCNPNITNLCDIARTMMLNDLSPGGQYGVYQDANGNFDPNFSSISIFKISSDHKNLLSAEVNTVKVLLPGMSAPASLASMVNDPQLLRTLIHNWPDDLSEKLLPLHPEYCYLKFCDLTHMQASNEFDTKFMNANTYYQAEQAGLTNNFSNNSTNIFCTLDPLYNNLGALQSGMSNEFGNFSNSGSSIEKLAIYVANCPSGTDINSCIGNMGDGKNDDEEWRTFKSLYYILKQEYVQKAREQYAQTQGCCNKNIGCNKPGRHCEIRIFPNPCELTNLLYYDAEVRFPTVNDIPFPNAGNLNQSLYDMSPQELAAHFQQGAEGNNEAICPTCPELDAFKLMLYAIQDKGWITTGKTVEAMKIDNLKDSLRTRFTGSNNDNTNITISAAANNSFSISNAHCSLQFQADTTIDFAKATFFPTCLEIADYKHAKLHLIVDGAYKTTLNITSTCDFFYCTGEQKGPKAPDPTCTCDQVFSASQVYKLGDIAQFNGTCYIVTEVSKVNQQGQVPAGILPTNRKFWTRICDSSIHSGCVGQFTLDFETPGGYTTPLTLATTNSVGQNKYMISNRVNIGVPAETTLPTNAFVSNLYGQTDIISKTVSVSPNTGYRLLFDYGLWSTEGQGTMTFEVLINGQSLGIISPSVAQLQHVQHRVFNWNSGNASTANILFRKTDNSGRKDFSLDNISLRCGSTLRFNPISQPPSNRDTSRYIPANVCGCNALCNPPLPMPELPQIPCDSILKDIATQQAHIKYEQYRDSVFHSMLNGYYTHCMKALESFTMDYTDAEYHYTLYYYDQSGNLVRTVPPAGVKPLNNAQLPTVHAARLANNNTPILPAHIMTTTYNHNSLNAVVWQKTPDAGESEFFYDDLGRIVLSQNAKQQAEGWSSYTYYDAQGRNVEVGKIKVGGGLKTLAANRQNWLSYITDLSTSRTEITHTYFDRPANAAISSAFGSLGQQHLRNRIGTVAIFADDDKLRTMDYSHATHFTYDVAGNVPTLLQDYGKSSPFGSGNVRNQSKEVKYYFDLVSGKVNDVHYQAGYADQFMHRYEYNADNKLTKVWTTANGIVWDNDARYTYYRHGPLARTELGSDHVQGIDHAYNLQGWIKGVNGFAIDPQADMGKDGNTTPLGPNNIGYLSQHNNTAPDVYSYWLSYYQGDYQPISQGVPTIANTNLPLSTGDYHTQPLPLYNGNIRSMYTYLQPFGGMGMVYKYDQLNRIKKQHAYTFNGLQAAPVFKDSYGMNLSYDANGNIQKLLRNGGISQVEMDKLNYTYYNNDGCTYTGNPTSPNATNRLASVADAIDKTNYTDDIDDQKPLNYSYDKIGNLISDSSEGIDEINWNLQNKVNFVKKNDKRIDYTYDAFGQRISKKVTLSTNAVLTPTTFYVRDAEGNTLAIYSIKKDSILLNEQHIYGSSRIGMRTPDTYLTKVTDLNSSPNTQSGITQYNDDAVVNPRPNSTPSLVRNYATYRNAAQYELINHLGNVLATISDAKTFKGGRSIATLLTATDYYAFGQTINDRTFALENKHRFGYNGKENDQDWGSELIQDYGFRLYNPALGRFLSVDPMVKKNSMYSTYSFATNSPVFKIDEKGGDGRIVIRVLSIKDRDCVLGKLSQDDIYELVKDEHIQSLTSAIKNVPSEQDFETNIYIFINEKSNEIIIRAYNETYSYWLLGFFKAKTNQECNNLWGVVNTGGNISSKPEGPLFTSVDFLDLSSIAGAMGDLIPSNIKIPKELAKSADITKKIEKIKEMFENLNKVIGTLGKIEPVEEAINTKKAIQIFSYEYNTIFYVPQTEANRVLIGKGEFHKLQDYNGKKLPKLNWVDKKSNKRLTVTSIQNEKYAIEQSKTTSGW